MDSINNLLNRIDAWGKDFNPETNESQSVFKRTVATRLATVFIGSILDITALAKEAFTAICVPTKKLLNKFKELSGSNCFDTVERNLPTTKNLSATMNRVAAYAIGAFSSVTVGIISPSANFDLHCNLNLARNVNQEAQEISALMQEIAYERKAKELLEQSNLITTEQQENIQKEVTQIQDAIEEVKDKIATAECVILNEVAHEAEQFAEDMKQLASEISTDHHESEKHIEKDSASDLKSELEAAAKAATAQAEQFIEASNIL